MANTEHDRDHEGNGHALPTHAELTRRVVRLEQHDHDRELELSGDKDGPGLRETVRGLKDSMARIESRANTVVVLLAVIALAAAAVALHVWLSTPVL